jgi:DNA repair exonuclease SbcCD ATPase subunit
MAHRDELEAALARADALERTVRELEQRMQDGQGDLPALRAELKRTRSDREALAEQIRTLEERVRSAESKREAVAQQLQKTEARLQSELAPRGQQARLPTLWEHNVATAAAAKPSTQPAGVACPRCRVEGHEVELVKGSGGQSFASIWLEEVICPRCLLLGHKGSQQVASTPEELLRMMRER